MIKISGIENRLIKKTIIRHVDIKGFVVERYFINVGRRAAADRYADIDFVAPQRVDYTVAPHLIYNKPDGRIRCSELSYEPRHKIWSDGRADADRDRSAQALSLLDYSLSYPIDVAEYFLGLR